MKRLTTILLSGLVGLQSFIFGQCFSAGLSSLGRLYESTGDDELDAKLWYYKNDMENVFDVKVQLYIYNDAESPNACAISCTPDLALCEDADGIVAYGYTMLLSKLWRSDQGGYAVVGVLAHEFAHVLQYVRGNNLPTKLKELHADFLAGYYLGRKQLMSGAVERFARALFEMGDFDFWNPNHHGTPQERVQAMSAGYIAGKSGASIHEAYKLGIEHVVMSSSYSDYVICSQCKGTKKIRVIERCSSCDGDGTKSCYYCKGHGRYYTDGPYGYGLYRCRVCKGGRFLRCSRCEGKGRVVTYSGVCYFCNGEGRVRRR